MRRTFAVAVLLLVTSASAGLEQQASKVSSYLPSKEIEKFVVEKLDLSTFRNSFGPRREPGMRSFADFGLRPTSVSKDSVEFKEADWTYTVKILGRRDYNNDGIEDLAIRFSDRSLTGSYQSESQLLLTRFSNDSRLIAIAYELDVASTDPSPAAN